MKGSGEEHDKRHFPLSSGERLKVDKLNLSPCIVFSFITQNMRTSSFFPCLILASSSTHISHLGEKRATSAKTYLWDTCN